MGIRSVIEEKRAWRAHMARVKALPRDYRVLYKKIQKYLFKVGPVGLTGENGPLAGIVGLFEEGAASGKKALDITGSDVAAFCDDLIKGSQTYDDIYRESADREVARAMRKALDKARPATRK